MRFGRRAILAGLVAAVALVPATARGHAAFVSSEPQPGAELGSAPGVVVLRFTEPLIARLSEATVTDPNGRAFEGKVSGEREMQVPLATNAPGVYRVEWKTVSPVDGHTLRGSFRFGVGVAPGQGAEGGTGSAPAGADVAIAVGRAVEYAGLLAAVGMLLLGRLARRDPSLGWVRPRVRAAFAVALGAGVTVVAGEALLAAGSPSPGAVASYLTSGIPGVARVVRLGAEALAVVAVGRGWAAGASAMGAMIALAAAGHAAAVPARWWAVSVDAAHLLSAGLWAGAILALATLRPPGGWRRPEGRALLDRFSPVAVAAFLVTVATGVLRGTQELSGLGDLWSTSYGQIVSVKVAAVLAMVPLSLLAWRRAVGSLRAEATVAAVAIGAAALLAAYPLPPARLGEAEAAEGRPDRTALPEPGDVTFGGEAGEVLLGVTVRPGEPGPNEVLVYVLPLEGEDAAPGVPVGLSTGGRTTEMEECGPTCRRAELDLRGGERLRIEVGGEAGGEDVIELPELPAPDGAALLRSMQERMHDLETYRLTEQLSSGRAAMEARYAFRAPDRMRIELDSGFQSVSIGETRYRRESPEEQWEKESLGNPVRVPFFIWDTREIVAPRVVGRDVVEDVRTRILSFFGPTGRTAIWFRLWIDSEGLVRRAEMRAQGHFMDHRYFAFDEPLRIRPPVAGA